MTSIFEFSSGVLVIVVGLAITHLLSGLGSIIRYRRLLKLDWLPIAWMLVLMLVLVGWCFAIWDMLYKVESLGYTTFLVFFFTSVMFYLAARLITPDIARNSELDLTEAFIETKTAFFASGTSAYLFIAIYASSEQGFMEIVSTLDGGLGFTLLLLMSVGMFLQKPISHWVLLGAWTVVFLVQQLNQGELAR